MSTRASPPTIHCPILLHLYEKCNGRIEQIKRSHGIQETVSFMTHWSVLVSSHPDYHGHARNWIVYWYAWYVFMFHPTLGSIGLKIVIAQSIYPSVCLSLCLFACASVRKLLTLPGTFDLQKLQCSYLVSIFNGSSTFRRYQSWQRYGLELDPPPHGWPQCNPVFYKFDLVYKI